jgi:hypothetical protein
MVICTSPRRTQIPPLITRIFYGFSFFVGDAWTGNSYPSQAFFTSHQGRLSFTHPGTHSVTAVNAMTGETHTVSRAQFGDRVVINTAYVSNEPILYIAG